MKNDLAYFAIVRRRNNLRNCDRQNLLLKRYVHERMKAARHYDYLRINDIGVNLVHRQNFNIVLEIVESRKII